MPAESLTLSPARARDDRQALAWYCLFLGVAWTGAWRLHESTPIHQWSEGGKLAYWTVAKVVIWISPILLTVRLAWRFPVAAYLGLVRFRAGVRTGLVVGAIFVGLSATLDVFMRSYAVPTANWGLLSAITVAPLFEELIFRGFALSVLADAGVRFWPANLVCAALFLGLHLPGWHFMGGLGPPRAIQGLSIVIIGLTAGYARRRAASTWASVTFHFVNNLYSAFLR